MRNGNCILIKNVLRQINYICYLNSKNNAIMAKNGPRPTKKSKTAKVDLKGEISIALKATSGRLCFST